MNQLEQFSRRKNVCIFGVKENKTEDTEKLALELGKKMNVSLNKDDLDETYRLGKPISGKDRPLLVSFNNLTKRTEFFNAKKYLKSSSVFLNDHLTAENNKLMYNLRQMKKTGKIYSVWSYLGVIRVKITENSRPMKVTQLDEIAMRKDSRQPETRDTAKQSAATEQNKSYSDVIVCPKIRTRSSC